MAMIQTLSRNSSSIKQKLLKYKSKIYWFAICFTVAFVYFKPQQFIDLWLTRDQQGTVLFQFNKYDQAATRFTNTRWQAYSLYGAEKFDQSATLYSQFNTKEDLLARANALAHNRRYIKARDMYKNINQSYPMYQAAIHNQQIVQKIIDDNNRLSDSQKAEEGKLSKELGDEAQSSDGAEKLEARVQEIEQMSAEQLLLDPALNEMWLRQVQKNPAIFLSRKFMMQNEKQKKEPLTTKSPSDQVNINE